MTGLLSNIGLCCSDTSRWRAEELVVQRFKETDLVPHDHDFAVSAAWDNCDTDATAKYESAIHNANIAATVYVRRSPGTPAHFVPETEWRKPESVTIDDIRNGLPRDDHKNIWEKFQNTVYGLVRRSPEYLFANGGEKSCLEAELRTAFHNVPVEVDTKLAFIMQGRRSRKPIARVPSEGSSRSSTNGELWSREMKKPTG